MNEPAEPVESVNTFFANAAGTIYGVLAVATVIAAEGTRQETTGKVLGASVITMVLYWLAHA